MAYLTQERIRSEDFLAPANNFSAGAEVLFFGVIRNHSEGRKVKFLNYEAYAPMAERLLEELVKEAQRAWPLEQVRLLHRTGRLELGDIAVAIGVHSAHRDEAYQASRFLIEQIKHQVPIWKKEYFEDGTSEWSLCSHDCLPSPSGRGLG